MRRFSIPVEDFDLELTLTCGQTFCWHRLHGDLFEDSSRENSWFYTFRNGKPVMVRQDQPDELTVKTDLEPSRVRQALGLNKNLQKVFSRFPDDKELEKAKKSLWGLRIVQDEFFPCLISYLCSPQMRIPRIKKMHNSISREYGKPVEVEQKSVYRFPTAEELSQASEEELRSLGVGYRAEYISETVDIIQSDFNSDKLQDFGYEEARKYLKQLHGVGDKVADCVLLFSCGFHEAYPVDTWAEKALKTLYPELHSNKYDELSRNVRDYFGQNAGYAQEYLFHAARNDVIEL